MRRGARHRRAHERSDHAGARGLCRGRPPGAGQGHDPGLACEDVAKLRASESIAAARRTQHRSLFAVAWSVDPRSRHAEEGRCDLTGACRSVSAIVRVKVARLPGACTFARSSPSAWKKELPMETGSDIVARAMRHEGVTDFFYIMGAPMMGVEKACMKLGLRGIDVRHEQAAAMAGFAYSRLLNRPSFCMVVSRSGVDDFLLGISNAW